MRFMCATLVIIRFVILHFVILLCAVSQGIAGTLPLAGLRPGVEAGTKPRVQAGTSEIDLSMATVPQQKERVERPLRQRLSSETENVLLLLLGIVLLLTFAVTRLWLSKKEDGEPSTFR